jgi:ribosome-associated toxin RatA of RatAB toxin-antitoxin module
MHTENTIFIQAAPDRIFALAADIEEWPRILPHYRWVTVFERSADGSRKVVEMAAVRDDLPVRGARFPVRWRSVQICEPDEGRIVFKHTGGIAVGMWVEWRIRPDAWGRGTEVSILHDLRYPLTVMNGLFAKNIVGELFVSAIAGRTLATIKRIAEEE